MMISKAFRYIPKTCREGKAVIETIFSDERGFSAMPWPVFGARPYRDGIHEVQGIASLASYAP